MFINSSFISIVIIVVSNCPMSCSSMPHSCSLKKVGSRRPASRIVATTSAGDSTKGRLDEGSVVHPRAWAPKIGMNGGYLGVQAARIVRSVLVVPRFFFSETAMGAHWPESVKSLLRLCHGTCGLGYRW